MKDEPASKAAHCLFRATFPIAGRERSSHSLAEQAAQKRRLSRETSRFYRRAKDRRRRIDISASLHPAAESVFACPTRSTRARQVRQGRNRLSWRLAAGKARKRTTACPLVVQSLAGLQSAARLVGLDGMRMAVNGAKLQKQKRKKEEVKRCSKKRERRPSKSSSALASSARRRKRCIEVHVQP